MSEYGFGEEEAIAEAKKRVEEVYSENLAKLHEEKTSIERLVETRLEELKKQLLEGLSQ